MRSARSLRPTVLLLAAATVVAGGCASAGLHHPSAGEPMRVTLYMFRQGQEFELANPAHTDPVELYSRTRASANTKVVEDEILLEIIDHLGSEGFSRYEKAGKAPGGGPYSLCFEIETAGGTSHWGTSQATSSPDELLAMRECVRYFLSDHYNRYQAFQTIQNEEGGAFFEDDGR
jgi:hypothetical protein